MPRYLSETLYGYSVSLEFADPDTADDGSLPISLVFVSPEKDSDGDPIHVVRYPVLGEHRPILAAAILGQPVDDAGLAAQPHPGDEPVSDGRCRLCGDRRAVEEIDACEQVEHVGSRDGLEQLAANGCKVALDQLNQRGDD
jgi:hypothetical protein